MVVEALVGLVQSVALAGWYQGRRIVYINGISQIRRSGPGDPMDAIPSHLSPAPAPPQAPLRRSDRRQAGQSRECVVSEEDIFG